MTQKTTAEVRQILADYHDIEDVLDTIASLPILEELFCGLASLLLLRDPVAEAYLRLILEKEGEIRIGVLYAVYRTYVKYRLEFYRHDRG